MTSTIARGTLDEGGRVTLPVYHLSFIGVYSRCYVFFIFIYRHLLCAARRTRTCSTRHSRFSQADGTSDAKRCFLFLRHARAHLPPLNVHILASGARMVAAAWRGTAFCARPWTRRMGTDSGKAASRKKKADHPIE